MNYTLAKKNIHATQESSWGISTLEMATTSIPIYHTNSKPQTTPELFEVKEFQQIIDIPTILFNNSVSLIDLIFFNSNSNLENLVLSATLPPIADHCGIFAHFIPLP